MSHCRLEKCLAACSRSNAAACAAVSRTRATLRELWVVKAQNNTQGGKGQAAPHTLEKPTACAFSRGSSEGPQTNPAVAGPQALC